MKICRTERVHTRRTYKWMKWYEGGKCKQAKDLNKLRPNLDTHHLLEPLYPLHLLHLPHLLHLLRHPRPGKHQKSNHRALQCRNIRPALSNTSFRFSKSGFISRKHTDDVKRAITKCLLNVKALDYIPLMVQIYARIPVSRRE